MLHLRVVDAEAGQVLLDVALEQGELLATDNRRRLDADERAEAVVHLGRVVGPDRGDAEALDLSDRGQLGKLLEQLGLDRVGALGGEATNGHLDGEDEQFLHLVVGREPSGNEWRFLVWVAEFHDDYSFSR